MWPIPEWTELLSKLDGRIVHLGSGSDPYPFECIEYFYDQPLQRVADLIRKAKTVITIDNGIGRLTHAVGHPRHIMLCSNAVGEVWGTYDEAHTIYGPPKEFGVQRVLDLIRSLDV
jgi:ADP-heptose:LPS heptosyltransferase